jgi:aldehyde dehydrogenase (NAD+)
VTPLPEGLVERARRQLFIGGEWITATGGDGIDVVSPASEAVIATIPSAHTADVDRAVAAARAAFDEGPWPRLTIAERVDALSRLSAALRKRADTLADVISLEVGSARSWATFGQVGTATGVLDAYVGFAAKFPWEDQRAGLAGNPIRVLKVPVGVVAAIVPWNAPLFTAALKLAPALVAGCSVVLKPAPEAPLYSYLLAEAALEAGLPAGVLNILPGGSEAGEHLVRHPGVDKVSFTGSTAVGRHIGALCGADVRRCTLELGGKSAAILLDDVELSGRTVKQLVSAAMANNGQVCAAQTRILAPQSRYREVVDALAAAVGALTVGDPFDEATDIGPLATSRQRDRVEGYLGSAREEGAVAVVGGGRPKGLERGWYIEPTVFGEVNNGMTIAREEIFGPVVAIIPYADDDEAVAVANDSDYGLTGTVWTSDIERGERIARRVRTGVVAINSPGAMDFGAPFGGFKKSGIGRECGPEGFEAYTEYQTIILPRQR